MPKPPEHLTGTICGIAQTDPHILGIYLFGSQAQNTATPTSDIDLGFLFKHSLSVREQIQLQSKFSEALDQEVDLVDLSTCNAFLALDIIRGERIYCSDPDACDEFDLYVLRRAGDLAPFEYARRKMLLSRQKPLLKQGARNA